MGARAPHNGWDPLVPYTRLHALHGQMNAHAHRAHVGVFAEGVDVGTRQYAVVVVVVGRGQVASGGPVLGRELCMSPRKHAFLGTAHTCSMYST